MKAFLLTRLTPHEGVVYPAGSTAVSAGFPTPSQDYRSASIDLNDVLIRDRNATYILRVSGSSMIDAGIADGDEIIVDRSIEPRDGSIVVASLDNEFTVKRFRIDPSGQGWLIAENPAYPPIPIPRESDFAIFGVVTRCIHHLD